MTDKRFTINNDMPLDNKVETYELSCLVDNDNKTFYFIVDSIANVESFVERLNELNEENEQLKQDRNALIHLLENQSAIIQELHSKLMNYQLKEPIVLTEEDLELMGKAISYYTHGRCGE